MMRYAIILLLLGIVSSGCTSARVAFIPDHEIDASNAQDLRLVSCSKYQHESLLDRMGLGVHAIGPVAVDGRAGLLYVRRKVRVGLQWGQPVTVDTYDLATGKKLRGTRIPRHADLTGCDTHSQSEAWMDVSQRLAYVEMDLGMGGTSVMRLNLEADAPQMVAKESITRLPPHPDAGERRLLLVIGERFEDEGVLWIDRGTGHVLGSYAWGASATYRTDRLGPQILGVVWPTVLGWVDHAQDGVELEVLQGDGERLRRINALTLPYPWRIGLTELDQERRQLIAVIHHAPHSDAVTQQKIRVYDLPSLTMTKEIPLEDDPASMGRIGQLLFLVSDESPQVLKVLDLETGQIVARKSLRNGWNDDWGGWDVFTDPHGLYVGVWGSHWIQLFAVKPD